MANVRCQRDMTCVLESGHKGNCESIPWPSAEALSKMITPKQIGGTHYETMGIQPWEVIERGELDFWEGNVVKYVMRYRDKNGLEDLQKARHYLDYLIEREKKNAELDI